MQSRCCQSTPANGYSNTNMDAGRRFESAFAVEAVEGWEAANRQRDCLDCKRTKQQSGIGRPRCILGGQPLDARRDVKLMLKIIMGNLTFRSRHGGRNCEPHRVKVEAGHLLLGRLQRGFGDMSLDVGIDDGASRTAASNRRRGSIPCTSASRRAAGDIRSRPASTGPGMRGDAGTAGAGEGVGSCCRWIRRPCRRRHARFESWPMESRRVLWY